MRTRISDRWLRNVRLTVCVVASIMIAGCGSLGGSKIMEPCTESKLLMTLPDICPTPDGMAMDKAGNIILACPNYGDMSKPAVFMKIESFRRSGIGSLNC